MLCCSNLYITYRIAVGLDCTHNSNMFVVKKNWGVCNPIILISYFFKIDNLYWMVEQYAYVVNKMKQAVREIATSVCRGKMTCL